MSFIENFVLRWYLTYDRSVYAYSKTWQFMESFIGVNVVGHKILASAV
jgi:hypothetical protein